MKHLIIVNPHAGKGRGIEVAWRVERFYRETGIEFSLKRTGGPGDAPRFAREGARDFDVVVGVGGDGTFHEIVNGLVSVALEPGVGPEKVAAAACIPIGTGNDFVKSLGLRADPDACLANLRDGRRKRIDVGRLRDGLDGAARYFANQVEVGYGASVVEDHASPDSLARRYLSGHLAYVATAVAKLPSETREVTLRADGWEWKGRYFEIHIANGKFCGGGVSFTPDAILDDGLLDVMTMSAELSVPTRLHYMLLRVKKGIRFDAEGISRSRARRLEVVDAAGAFPIAADGELIEIRSGTLVAEVLPGALDVLAPAAAAAGPA